MTARQARSVPPVRAVVFDLDGTLVQTRHASWEVFRRVNDRFDLGIQTPEAFYALFRDTSVFRALEEICDEPDRARRVKDDFLRRLRAEYLPPMIPGMADVVRSLSTHLTLCVLSSNVMEVVRRILVANGLEYCFAHVFTADVEPDKSRVLERLISDPEYGCRRRGLPAYEEHTAVRGLDARETLMVTDTLGDVREAQRAGIRAMGVTWGMHTQPELLEAGVEFVALWPQEIGTYLLPDDREAGAEHGEHAGRAEVRVNGRGDARGATPGRREEVVARR